MRWVVLVHVVAGCSFSASIPATSDDAPVVPDAQEPTVDAPISPGGDLDGDGVPDAQDNCPDVKNPNQDNEDGDAHGGDACDLCPHLGDPQTDADNDKIGAGCDPRLGTADVLLLFEGFNTPAAGVPAGWTTEGGGQWAVSNGKLHHTSVDNNAGIALWMLPLATGDHTVDATATLGAKIDGGTTVFGVITDANPTRFYHCAVREDNPQAELFNYNSVTNQWMPMATTPRTIMIGGTYRVIGRASPDDQDCNAAGVELDGGGNTFNGTRAGIRVRELDVSIPYVAIYASP